MVGLCFDPDEDSLMQIDHLAHKKSPVSKIALKTRLVALVILLILLN